MKIKQLIEAGGQSACFHIDEDGSLILEMNNEMIEVPHLVALELVEYLRLKLYEHQETNHSLLKRLFR
jgi:hypothetical protein